MWGSTHFYVTLSLHFCVNLIVKKAQNFMMMAWEGYLSLHKFAGFPAFHLNLSKPFVCSILLKCGYESIFDTNFGGVIQTWTGQYYKDVNYRKVQKKFCFDVLALQNLDGLLS